MDIIDILQFPIHFQTDTPLIWEKELGLDKDHMEQEMELVWEIDTAGFSWDQHMDCEDQNLKIDLYQFAHLHPSYS